MKRYILYNPVDGFFLGVYLNKTFWTKSNDGGQLYIPSFTEEEIESVAAKYAPVNADLNGNIRCIDVPEEGMDYTYVDRTIAEFALMEQSLEPTIPDRELNFVCCCVGH